MGGDPNGEEEEIDIQGTGGSADDQLFDSIIGTVEQFMFELNPPDLMAKILPKFKTVTNEHDQHSEHKRFIAYIEKSLDELIRQEYPQVEFERVAELITKRKDEISPEVEEFVNGGFMEYESFIALWKSLEE
eukprot:GILJ01029391.1.p1 GENE.GILJ01029391.1~~GILJ01029391.1.p1  ORF type:complete len:132 (-),score=28.60 GILJ01029391.1:114-509(-)